MSRRPIKPAIGSDQQQQQLHIVPATTAQDDKQDLGGSSGGGVDDEMLSPTTPTTVVNKNKRKAQPSSVPPASASVPGAAPGTPAKRPRTNTPWTAAEELRLKNMRDAGNSWSEIAKTFPTRTEGSVKKHWYKVCSPSCPLIYKEVILTLAQDMHYAEFGEDEVGSRCSSITFLPFEIVTSGTHGRCWLTAHWAAKKSAALLTAIREYDANKWKVIGQKVGKPAKV